jgi:Leucine-rich repeat (LRR) protein
VVGLNFHQTNLSSLPLGIENLPSLAYLMLQNMNFLANIPEKLSHLPNLQEIELNTWTPLSLRAQEILKRIKEKNVEILWIPPARRRLHISKKQWIFTLIIGAILVDMLVFLWFASELFW